MAKQSEATRTWRKRAWVTCIALVSLIVIILVALLSILIWLAVQPKRLRYSVERGSFAGVNVTNDDYLGGGNFSFAIRADNPNRKVSFYYDKMDVSVSYKGQTLAANNVSRFYQPTRNVTQLELNIVAKNMKLPVAEAKDLKMKRGSGDVVLDVIIWAKIRMKIGIFKVHRTVKVLCGSLTVPFSSSSSSKDFKRLACNVYLRSW